MIRHIDMFGDVTVAAAKDGASWTIRSERGSTGEALSLTTGAMTDFAAGQLFGEQCAMWRYAITPVSQDMKELTEEPICH